MSTPAASTQLAQIRPANTSAAVAYTAPADYAVEVTRIFVCNTTSSAADASLFHDNSGGGTYDQTTALYYAYAVAANSTLEIGAQEIGLGIALSPGAQIGVQSGTGNALTFSLYGIPALRVPR